MKSEQGKQRISEPQDNINGYGKNSWKLSRYEEDDKPINLKKTGKTEKQEHEENHTQGPSWSKSKMKQKC